MVLSKESSSVTIMSYDWRVVSSQNRAKVYNALDNSKIQGSVTFLVLTTSPPNQRKAAKTGGGSK